MRTFLRLGILAAAAIVAAHSAARADDWPQWLGPTRDGVWRETGLLEKFSPEGAGDPAKPLLGIYEFDGEALRICNALPGKPRPTSFEAKPGANHTQIVWIRETQ